MIRKMTASDIKFGLLTVLQKIEQAAAKREQVFFFICLLLFNCCLINDKAYSDV